MTAEDEDGVDNCLLKDLNCDDESAAQNIENIFPLCAKIQSINLPARLGPAGTADGPDLGQPGGVISVRLTRICEL